MIDTPPMADSGNLQNTGVLLSVIVGILGAIFGWISAIFGAGKVAERKSGELREILYRLEAMEGWRSALMTEHSALILNVAKLQTELRLLLRRGKNVRDLQDDNGDNH